MSEVATPFRQVHLNPGDLIITEEALHVTTVLGSCVAVTMYRLGGGLAAICHAMMPRACDGRALASGERASYRFVEGALPSMIEAFGRRGVGRREIEVKMFGGARVIEPHAGTTIAGRDIGRANIHAARVLLAEAGLVLRATNVGGTCGRKIVFNTSTGDVFHRHLVR